MTSEDAVATAQSSFMTALFAGDRAACDQILAPDFSALRPDDDHAVEVVLRDRWLDEMAGRPREHVTVNDTVVSTHGGLAIATVLWIENPDEEQIRRCETNVWTCASDGKWQLAERHTTWCEAK